MVLGLIYQKGEMVELRRRGAEVNAGKYEEAEEESEGSIPEGVVGDGCHEGEEEGEQKLRGCVLHVGEGGETHFGDSLRSSRRV
jgi:hypothetical protein